MVLEIVAWGWLGELLFPMGFGPCVKFSRAVYVIIAWALYIFSKLFFFSLFLLVMVWGGRAPKANASKGFRAEKETVQCATAICVRLDLSVLFSNCMSAASNYQGFGTNQCTHLPISRGIRLHRSICMSSSRHWCSHERRTLELIQSRRYLGTSLSFRPRVLMFAPAHQYR